MASFVTTTGVTATAAAGTIKVGIQLAAPSTQDAVLKSVSVSGTGAASSGTWLVELVRETGVSSGGSTFTPAKYGAAQGKAAVLTARINDTTDGAGPTILEAYEINNTGLAIIRWPLGDELYIPVSTWLAIRVTVPSSGATGSYVVNAVHSEG